MIKTSIAVLAVALAWSAPSHAFGFGDALDRYEQRKILEAEFERSSKVGGYTDPITALINLFNGETEEKDVQRTINDGQAAKKFLYQEGSKAKFD